MTDRIGPRAEGRPVETYAEVPPGTVDVSIVATAEQERSATRPRIWLAAQSGCHAENEEHYAGG